MGNPRPSEFPSHTCVTELMRGVEFEPRTADPRGRSPSGYSKEVKSSSPSPPYSGPIKPEGVEKMRQLEKEFCVHQISRMPGDLLSIANGRLVMIS